MNTLVYPHYPQISPHQQYEHLFYLVRNTLVSIDASILHFIKIYNGKYI